MGRKRLLLVILGTCLATGCTFGGAGAADGTEPAAASEQGDEELPHFASQPADDWHGLKEDDWRQRLDPLAFRVLREDGTERAFSSPLLETEGEGVYVCAGCGADLFRSDEKYDSGTGWPSFWAPLADAPVGEREDRSHRMVRTEVHCERCGGHLGHVFPDGPEPTGLRYCINGAALHFEPTDSP